MSVNSLWEGRRFRIVEGSPGFGFKVRIPAALRSWTEEQARVRVAGMGMRSLMDTLEIDLSRIRERLSVVGWNRKLKTEK